MQRRESQFTTKFRKWVLYRWNENSYFEIKTSEPNKTSIPFREVKQKQKINLKIKKFVFKFSDFDRMGTPFDMVSFFGKGYIVVYFWKRANKEFFLIDIEDWCKEEAGDGRRSLTEDRAREIGIRGELV